MDSEVHFKDSQIWVANLGLHPVEIVTAECVTDTPGTCPEDEERCRDEVEGLVLRAAHISMRRNADNCERP